MLWNKTPSLDTLTAQARNTAIAHLGIEYTRIGDDSLSARMPVDHRTQQPFGILHGGASVLLAETLGSAAASLCIDTERFACVGIEINANHVRAVRSGFVSGTARPVHIGRSTHVWAIEIHDEADRLVCVTRLTMAIIPRDNASGQHAGQPPAEGGNPP